MPITATAPGKLFLLGEYSVLEGGPAVVAAVDRRARVEATSATTWSITAPGVGIHELALAGDGGVPAGLGPRELQGLAVYAAVRETLSAHVETPAPLAITVASAGFYQDGRKLGLGSSAAVATALSAALARAVGLDAQPQTTFELAREAHRRAQAGRGSGADVAASTFGGVLVYRQGDKPLPARLPPALEVIPIHTGTAASTVDLVARVYALERRDPAAFRSCFAALTTLAEAGAGALAEGSAADFRQATDAYREALERLGEAAGVDIVSPVHRRLHEIVRDAGGSYKPSGAGHGDFGVAFALGPCGRAAVSEAVAKAGFCAIDLRLATSGLAVSGKR